MVKLSKQKQKEYKKEVDAVLASLKDEKENFLGQLIKGFRCSIGEKFTDNKVSCQKSCINKKTMEKCEFLKIIVDIKCVRAPEITGAVNHVFWNVEGKVINYKGWRIQKYKYQSGYKIETGEKSKNLRWISGKKLLEIKKRIDKDDGKTNEGAMVIEMGA